MDLSLVRVFFPQHLETLVEPSIGFKITDFAQFKRVVEAAVTAYGRIEKISAIPCNLNECASSGYGLRSRHPNDYVVQLGNAGLPELFLRRHLASPFPGDCGVLVVEAGEFLGLESGNPLTPEQQAVLQTEATHVATGIFPGRLLPDPDAIAARVAAGEGDQMLSELVFAENLYGLLRRSHAFWTTHCMVADDP